MLTTYNFQEQGIRTLTRDSEPWFVAKDVCDTLGLADTNKATVNLDDDELTRTVFVSGGQKREHLIVSESGLYALIFKSRKPEARAFQRWVTKEVLPAIRKTGFYATDPTLKQFITRAIELREEIEELEQKKLTMHSNYLTVREYAGRLSLCITRGQSIRIGRLCTTICNREGVTIEKIKAKYCNYGMYPEHIIRRAIKELGGVDALETMTIKRKKAGAK